MQDSKSSAFVQTIAARGASFQPDLGPRSVSCLRSTSWHNPAFEVDAVRRRAVSCRVRGPRRSTLRWANLLNVKLKIICRWFF